MCTDTSIQLYMHVYTHNITTTTECRQTMRITMHMLRNKYVVTHAQLATPPHTVRQSCKTFCLHTHAHTDCDDVMCRQKQIHVYNVLFLLIDLHVADNNTFVAHICTNHAQFTPGHTGTQQHLNCQNCVPAHTICAHVVRLCTQQHWKSTL